MSLDVENYIPVIKDARGYYSKYPVIAPVQDTGGQVFSVKAAPFNAKGNGVADDTAAIKAAMAAATPTGATVFFPPGNYVISSPLVVAPPSNSPKPVLAPSLIGAPGRPGPSKDMASLGSVRLIAASSFPVGEFMIDYIGPTTDNTSNTGYTVAGFVLNCNSLGAGIRSFNSYDCLWKDLVITNNPATPNPANTAGTPTGAVSFVANPSFNACFNRADNIYVSYAAKDGFQFQEGSGSFVMATNCNTYVVGRNGYIIGDSTVVTGCSASGSINLTGQIAADWYIQGSATMANCNSFNAFPANGNGVLIGSGTFLEARVAGCKFYGPGTASMTEQQAALVRFNGGNAKVTFSGCTFLTGNHTSDYIWCAGNSSGNIIFDGCTFDQSYNSALTNTRVNTNGTNVLSMNNCIDINPNLNVAKGNVAGATTFSSTDGSYQTATQTGDITVTLSSGVVVGDKLTLEIITGGHTQSWPGNLKLAGGAYAMTGTSTLTIRWDGTNWVEQSRAANIS